MTELHRERDRAESFGEGALAYERYRPDFPAALFDELAALGARTALDVACGTGKVARGLAARGLDVTGVEIDPRMAEVARSSGIAVEVAAFESWDDGGRRFDLVACGDAWHWIDPARGAAAVARVLRPGGTFAWFWNVPLLDEDVLAALEVVIAAHAPHVLRYGSAPPPSAFVPPPLDGPFSPAETRGYTWERRVTGAEWAGFCGTTSDHRRLAPEVRAALLAAIEAAIARIGEPIVVRGRTTAHVYRRL